MCSESSQRSWTGVTIQPRASGRRFSHRNWKYSHSNVFHNERCTMEKFHEAWWAIVTSLTHVWIQCFWVCLVSPKHVLVVNEGTKDGSDHRGTCLIFAEDHKVIQDVSKRLPSGLHHVTESSDFSTTKRSSHALTKVPYHRIWIWTFKWWWIFRTIRIACSVWTQGPMYSS